MSEMVTIQNAPRDIQQLAGLPRTVRYRLGLTLNMWGGDENVERAYTVRTDEEQAADLLMALQRYDTGQIPAAGNGAAQSVVQAPAPVMQAPKRMPVTTSDPGVQVPQVQIQAPQRTPATGPVQAPAPDAGSMLVSQLKALMMKVGNAEEGQRELSEEVQVLKSLLSILDHRLETVGVMNIILMENLMNMPRNTLVKLVFQERESLLGLLKSYQEGRGGKG